MNFNFVAGKYAFLKLRLYNNKYIMYLTKLWIVDADEEYIYIDVA
jgi:hypothetical protein